MEEEDEYHDFVNRERSSAFHQNHHFISVIVKLNVLITANFRKKTARLQEQQTLLNSKVSSFIEDCIQDSKVLN